MASADDVRRIKRIIGVRVPVGVLVLLAAELAIAGTVLYWQAWLMAGTLLGLLVTVGLHFLRTDPDFLVHRLQFREKEEQQKRLSRPTQLLFVPMTLLPALDIRLGWSRVPAWVCLVAWALFLASYGFVLWVFKVNRYASRIVEVQPGQRVIDVGPYAVVRHPMYAALAILYPAYMIALGTWWGGLAGLTIMIIIVIRLLDEERVLARDLPGYADYCRRTRYRLIPFVW